MIMEKVTFRDSAGVRTEFCRMADGMYKTDDSHKYTETHVREYIEFVKKHYGDEILVI